MPQETVTQHHSVTIGQGGKQLTVVMEHTQLQAMLKYMFELGKPFTIHMTLGGTGIRGFLINPRLGGVIYSTEPAQDLHLHQNSYITPEQAQQLQAAGRQAEVQVVKPEQQYVGQVKCVAWENDASDEHAVLMKVGLGLAVAEAEFMKRQAEFEPPAATSAEKSPPQAPPAPPVPPLGA